MKDQVCTESQMQELSKLGVSSSRCSACLLTMKYGDGKEETIVTEPCSLYGEASIPVFTIPDMLDRMPEKVVNGETYLFQLLKEENWICRYYCVDYDTSLIESCNLSLRDAVYEVFKYLAILGK